MEGMAERLITFGVADRETYCVFLTGMNCATPKNKIDT